MGLNKQFDDMNYDDVIEESVKHLTAMIIITCLSLIQNTVGVLIRNCIP